MAVRDNGPEDWNVQAQFPGRCSACGQEYPVGAIITGDGGMGWQHQRCPQQGPLAGIPSDSMDASREARRARREARRKQRSQGDQA